MRSTRTKASQQQIHAMTMFQYYLTELFPRLFKLEQQPTPGKHYQSANNGLTYCYYNQELCHSGEVEGRKLAELVTKHYTQKSKTRDGKDNEILLQSQVQSSWLGFTINVTDSISVINRSVQKIVGKSKQSVSSSTSSSDSQGNSSLSRVYIIHKPINEESAQQSSKWQQFIQRYSIDSTRNVMSYQAVFVTKSKGMISIDQSHNLLKKYFMNSLPKERELREIARKCQIQKPIQGMEVSNSFEAKFRRQLYLATENVPIFKSIQAEASNYYKQVNLQKPRAQFLDNLICRILAQNKYDQQQTLTDVKYYIDYDKQMRQQYTIDSFSEFEQMNIFEHLGLDKHGRPIILFNISNQKVSQIKDIGKFIDYYFFVMDIDAQDRMQGWADQTIELWDSSGFSSDNFSLSLTKQQLEKAFKIHYLSRAARTISFNNGFMSKTALNIIKGLLPKEALETLTVLGSDKQEIRKELSSDFNLEVVRKCIPQ